MKPTPPRTPPTMAPILEEWAGEEGAGGEVVDVDAGAELVDVTPVLTASWRLK